MISNPSQTGNISPRAWVVLSAALAALGRVEAGQLEGDLLAAATRDHAEHTTGHHVRLPAAVQ